MKYDFTPMGQLIGYTVGFIAGVYSLFLGRPSVSNPFEFMLCWIWYGLISGSIVANAYGMLHQVELWQTCSDTPTEGEAKYEN